MRNRGNFIFACIILGALFLVLAATGALPVIVQLLTLVFQVIALTVLRLIGR